MVTLCGWCKNKTPSLEAFCFFAAACRLEFAEVVFKFAAELLAKFLGNSRTLLSVHVPLAAIVGAGGFGLSVGAFRGG